MGRHKGAMRKGEVLFWLLVAVVAVMVIIPFLLGVVE
jgi:hypothetical protein